MSKYTRNSNPKRIPRKTITPKKLGFEEALKAVTEKHVEQIKVLGEQTLTKEDIPRLRKQWVDNCQDIMNGVPDELPPIRGVNHHIPLINEDKWYNYHLPRCPDAMKPQLLEKIARYTRAVIRLYAPWIPTRHIFHFSSTIFHRISRLSELFRTSIPISYDSKLRTEWIQASDLRTLAHRHQQYLRTDLIPTLAGYTRFSIIALYLYSTYLRALPGTKARITRHMWTLRPVPSPIRMSRTSVKRFLSNFLSLLIKFGIYFVFSSMFHMLHVLKYPLLLFLSHFLFYLPPFYI